MRKGLILLILVLLLQFPCIHAATNMHLPQPSLGVGYSDDTQMPLGMSCLNIKGIEYGEGTKATIALGRSYSFSEIEKELNVNISADASIHLFSLNAKASYARYIKDSRYSSAFYFLEKILLPTKAITTNFGTDALNSFGLAAYKAGPAQFRLTCGNKFHQQVEMGVLFFTTFKLVFNSSFEKTKFSTSVSGNFINILQAKSKIQEIIQQKNIHGVLEILALQEGGNPTQLAKIFEKCNEHYCITSCSFENLDACQGTIDGIISYAKNYLPEQINYNPQTHQVSGTANPLRYEYMDYRQLGLTVGPSELTTDAFAARQSLGHIFKSTLYDQELVDHILNSYVSVSIAKEYKDKLLNLSEALHSNAALLESDNGAMGCYLDPNKCVSIKNNLEQFLKPIDVTTLNKFKVGYLTGGTSIVIGTPIGGDQFLWFDQRGVLVLQLIMSFSADRTSLHVFGSDSRGAQLSGDLSMTTPGTYKGVIRYHGGLSFKIPMQFIEVENPV